MNNSEEDNLENVENIIPDEKEDKIIQENNEYEEKNELEDSIKQESTLNENIGVNKEVGDNTNIKENITTIDEVGESQPIDPNDMSETNKTEKKEQLEIRDIQKNLVEGALYAAGRPLNIEELATKLEIPKKLTEILVSELAMEYLERTTSLIIAQVGDRYQMQLRPEYTESVAKFAKGGAIAERYLRTLTIIALKQPILKSTVVKIRGSGAYEHIKYLIDNDLINAVKKGRSFDLTTTDKYSEMFGLPKDKLELKKMMIQQLGVEPSSETPEDPSE